MNQDCQLPRHALILNCFGRGGSNIVWNMIGSSPDAIMPPGEWHQAVFGKHNWIRKTMRGAGRIIDWNLVPGFTRFAAERTRLSLAGRDAAARAQAKAVTLKVMGHHIVFANAIEAAFDSHRHIILTRHPLAMCEGFIRGGKSERAAVATYNGIVRNMMGIARRGALQVTFEAMIADPAAFCARLQADLGLTSPADGLIRYKRKTFGAERTTRDHGAREVVRLTPDELRREIDANANRDAVSRLTDAQRRSIWQATRETASAFGYTEENY